MKVAKYLISGVVGFVVISLTLSLIIFKVEYRCFKGFEQKKATHRYDSHHKSVWQDVRSRGHMVICRGK